MVVVDITGDDFASPIRSALSKIGIPVDLIAFGIEDAGDEFALPLRLICPCQDFLDEGGRLERATTSALATFLRRLKAKMRTPSHAIQQGQNKQQK